MLRGVTRVKLLRVLNPLSVISLCDQHDAAELWDNENHGNYGTQTTAGVGMVVNRLENDSRGLLVALSQERVMLHSYWTHFLV